MDDKVRAKITEVSSTSDALDAILFLGEIQPDGKVGLSLAPDSSKKSEALRAAEGNFAKRHSSLPLQKNSLNKDVEIQGQLVFSGELILEGRLEGEITGNGRLDLGDSATVIGTISVTSAVLNGEISAEITAEDKIEVRAKTKLFGDIRARRLVVEEGATLVGKIAVTPVGPVRPDPMSSHTQKAAMTIPV